MHSHLTSFLIHWVIIALSLWAASGIFKGIRFTDASSLLISALLLGLANALLRPVLVFLTLPLTVLTLGLFLLVINALMLMLVSALVRGFRLSGFWTAFFASIFITLLSLLLSMFLLGGRMSLHTPMTAPISSPATTGWL